MRTSIRIESQVVNLTWVAEHLAMCSAANASQQIRHPRRAALPNSHAEP